jgi:outer membrane biosynthesis protein TonB
MNDTTLGIIAAAVPLIVIGFFALRRLPWIFAFFIALVAVGIGYLETTGAMKEVGHKVRAELPAGMLSEHKKAEESAPPEGGAMKALPPPTAPESSSTQTPAAAPTTPPPAAESTPPPAAEPAPTPPATPAPESAPQNPTPPAAPTPAPSNP